MFLSATQILKVGRNVNQDLRRLANECGSGAQFVRGVDLASMAKARNVISNARLGLADICAAVLNLRLDKSDPARLGSDWNSERLSDGQIQYAARDVYASLQIYLCLAQMSKPEVIPLDAPPSTPIALYHDDGKLIANGTLEASPSERLRGVSVTQTRAKIVVEEVLIPGAVVPLHKAPLNSFGAVPFEIVAKRNKLKTRSTIPPTEPHNPSSESHTKSTGSPHIQPQFDDEFTSWLNRHDSPDNNLADDVDDNPETLIEEDGNVAEAEVDNESLQEGLSTFAAAASNSTTWSRITRSLVLMDIWHAMARIRVSRTHGFRRPFARALRDAILIPDEQDRNRITAYLISIGSSREETLRMNPKWLWKRCKRVVPPPEILYPAVEEVYKTYGPLLDAATSTPLFNRQAWKDAKNILKSIQLGLLSDPPDVPLYFGMGVELINSMAIFPFTAAQEAPMLPKVVFITQVEDGYQFLEGLRDMQLLE